MDGYGLASARDYNGFAPPFTAKNMGTPSDIKCYPTLDCSHLLRQRVFWMTKLMLLISRVLFLFLAVLSGATAGLITGTVTFNGNVIQYQAFNGTDPAAFNAFLAGAQLTDFENVAGVTPLAVAAYTGAPTAAANLIDATVAINGAFFSAGGQTPGNPANGGAPGVLVDVSTLNGAHSGNNVLGPTAQGDPETPLDFNGFISINFPLAQPISRFGWWTNPQGGNVNFAPHLNAIDSGGNLVDLSAGIAFTASPGEFVAFAFSQSVLNEVELFQTGPMTVDDFVYARDNELPFGTTVVPEPGTWGLLALGCSSLAIARIRRGAAGKRRMIS